MKKLIQLRQTNGRNVAINPDAIVSIASGNAGVAIVSTTHGSFHIAPEAPAGVQDFDPVAEVARYLGFVIWVETDEKANGWAAIYGV